MTTNNKNINRKSATPKADRKNVAPVVPKPIELSAEDINKQTMFDYFSGNSFNVGAFGTAKKNNVKMAIAEDFIKSIANNMAKLSGKRTGIFFLNEYRLNKFDEKLLTEKRLKYYQSFLNRQYSVKLSFDDVKKAIHLGAVKLWSVGNKLDAKRVAIVKEVTQSETLPAQTTPETLPSLPARVSFKEFVDNKGIDFDGLTVKSKEYKELKKEYDGIKFAEEAK